ncbi:MAG: tyrosine-type recombinase/integrase [Nocardioidaceae bacterium]
MAYAEQRGKKWRGRYKRPDGTRGSTSGYPTKKQALAAAEDEESRIRHHTWIDPRVSETPFADFAEDWYAAISPGLGPRTAENYRNHLDRHLLPKWESWSMMAIFNSHLEIQKWVTELHTEYEESSVRTYFGTFSTIMNAAVRARVIPANPCAGIRVTEGAWESEKLVATPVQVLRASMRLYENGLGLGGLVLGLLNSYTGARWGELAGQTRREYDELNRAIGIIEPLKEINGRLVKGGHDVTEHQQSPRKEIANRRRRRSKRGARTKSPAGTRWICLPPSLAQLYELLLDGLPDLDSFAFVSTHGVPWYRSNFRQRFWRPVWDGVSPDDPEAEDHEPAILFDFTFHEGRHTHSTWLVQDGIPEVARRARLGHKMPGIAKIYEHVTPEMERRVSDALETRWLGSLSALTDDERSRLATWVADLTESIEAASRSRAASGDGSVSQMTPSGR